MADPGRELLAAIRADPGDDRRRLVYADYLEDRGRLDRAALIRVQCGRAQLASSDPRRLEQGVLEWLLYAEHGTTWRRELPQLPGLAWAEPAEERGLPTRATVESCALWSHLEALAAVAPTASLSLEGAQIPTSVPDSPWLPDLRIDVGPYGRVCIERLVDGPLARHVRVLRALAPGSAPIIARAAQLDGVVELHLGLDESLGVLAGASHLKGLRKLVLGSREGVWRGLVHPLAIDRAWADQLAVPARSFAGLHHLVVHGHVGASELATLLASQNLANLRVLSVYGLRPPLAPASPPDLDAAFDSGPMRLGSLEIPGSRLSLELASAALHDRLHEGVRIPRTMRVLGLRANGLDATDVYGLFRVEPLPHLHTLDLAANPLGAAGARVLAGAPLGPLVALDVMACGVGDEGL